MTSRLIWEIHFGPIPDGLEVDHKDRNKLNNFVENYELKTRSGNACNRGVHSNNALGMKGVSRDSYNPTMFRAFIKKNGKTVNLGKFETAQLAQAAYITAGGIV